MIATETTFALVAYTDEDFEADAQVYSDLYKDVWGYRPRGIRPTRDEMPAIMADLQRRLNVELEYQRKGQILAQYRFEKRIATLCQRNGWTRPQAIEAIAQHQDCYYPAGENDDGSPYAAFIDYGMLCYRLDLPYALERQIEHDYKGELA